MRSDATSYLDSLRLQELQLVLPALSSAAGAGSRLLEIGAGTGAQAAHLSEAGYEVSAVDLANGLHTGARVFPIVDYDGIRLPFEDASFDLVFSSNVMEHVDDFAALQSEQMRVLRPEGKALHVVPSGVWAAATLAGYWLTLPRAAARKLRRGQATVAASNSAPLGSSLKNRLIPPAHGVFAKSLTAEISEFSEQNWRGRFEGSGWRVEQYFRVALFYTGHAVFGARLPWAARTLLARGGLGACHCYVLRR